MSSDGCPGGMPEEEGIVEPITIRSIYEHDLRNLPCSIEHDLQGQIVIYTGVFLWSDGKYRYGPEPIRFEDGDAPGGEEG